MRSKPRSTLLLLVAVLSITIVVGMSSQIWAYINAGFKSEAEARAHYRSEADRKEAERLAILNNRLLNDPDDEVAFYQRGKIYSAKGRKYWNLALADFDAALRLNPNFSQAYFYRSLVHTNLQDYSSSCEDLKAMLSLEPTSDDARFRLAVLYFVSPDESVRDLVKAREIAESQASLHPQLLAAICAELGDVESAVRWQTEACSKVSRSPSVDPIVNAYRRGEICPEIRRGLEGYLTPPRN